MFSYDYKIVAIYVTLNNYMYYNNMLYDEFYDIYLFIEFVLKYKVLKLQKFF